MPVSEVTSADVLEILAPIWHTKADTARRLRQRIRAVLEWAVAMEFRIDNPCDRIGPVLGPQHNVVQHMRALAASRGGRGHPDGAGIDGTAGRPAGIRVPGTDGCAMGRDAVGGVDRDRSGERRVDRTG